ncbi:RAD50 [Ecytonucleospora hepatopenaei]|uniref:RAD50 n=1 Tax=Ecytonucleospora hepatopenaei TaxID=646526 RepID=A0A1W0E462_9MICR|nr:RAD50 [Ecytonucleospora hepatopenaei]
MVNMENYQRTKLCKLELSGIRAFDATKTWEIDFEDPITLIVGKNGSGKTTIIEILKYLTTGDLPPNSKNGAFVFDPSFSKEISTRATMKLIFDSENGKRYVIQKTLHCERKAKKVEQRTLECLLFESKEGEEENKFNESSKDLKLIGDKVVEVIKWVPHYLGTNSSILQNVIFCHQEEIAWPLGDTTVLKKKLDEIFCSSQYNKALLQLKSTKTEIERKIELRTVSLRHELQQKIEKEEAVKKYNECLNSINEKMDLLEKLSSKREIIKTKVDDLKNKIKEQETLENEYKNLQNTLSECKKIIDEYENKSEYKNIALFNNLKEEHDVKKHIKETEEEIEKQKETLKNINLPEIKAQVALAENKFNFITENLEKKKVLDEKYLQLNTKIGFLTSQLENLKKDLCMQLTINNSIDLFTLKNEMNEKYSKIKQEQMKDIENKQHEIKEREEFIKEIHKNNEKCMKYGDFVKKCEEDMTFKRFKMENNAEFSKEDLITNLEECERKIILLNSNLNENQNRKTHVLSLESEHKEILEEITFITKTIDGINYEQEINVDSDDIKKEIKRIKNENVKLEKICKQKQEEVFKTEINHSVIKRKESELIILFDRLIRENKDLLQKGEIYHKLNIEKLIDLFQTDQKTENMFKYFEMKKYLSIMDLIKDCENCFVCDGKVLESKKYLNRIKEVFNCSKTSSPDVFVKNFELIIKNKDFYEKCNIVIKKLNEISKDFISLKNDKTCHLFDNLQAEKDKLIEIEKLIDKNKNTLKIKEELLENISIRKNKLEKNNEKLKTLNQKLTKNNFNNKSLSEVENEIKNVEILLKQEQSKKDEMQKQLYTMENHMAYLEKLKKYNLAKKFLKENEVVDISEKTKHLSKLKENFNSLNKHQNEFVSSFNSKFSDFNKILNEYACATEEKKKIENDSLFAKSFDKEQAEYFEVKKKFSEVHEKACQLQLEISKKQEFINSLRFIGNFFQKRDFFEKNKGKIKYDKEKHDSLKETLTTYIQKIAKIESLKHQTKGQLNELSNFKEIRKHEIEKFKKTTEKYNEIYYEIKILEMSLSDVKKSMTALEKAIIEYHSVKMEEVNIILKDLWINTYAGNDIEYIELSSDLTATSYNYKIVQCISGIKTDMRGRCSAGQKIIASILFKIALAEAFSSSTCEIDGDYSTRFMLTLDEPTTSLDKQNTEKLAETLNNLIDQKKDFQLIVITHDENFVRLISKTDTFYRIFKNNKGRSCLKKESVYTTETF